MHLPAYKESFLNNTHFVLNTIDNQEIHSTSEPPSLVESIAVVAFWIYKKDHSAGRQLIFREQCLPHCLIFLQSWSYAVLNNIC